MMPGLLGAGALADKVRPRRRSGAFNFTVGQCERN